MEEFDLTQIMHTCSVPQVYAEGNRNIHTNRGNIISVIGDYLKQLRAAGTVEQFLTEDLCVCKSDTAPIKPVHTIPMSLNSLISRSYAFFMY